MITIDQKIADFISTKLNVKGWPWGNLLLCFIALALCLFLVGIIGIEREKRGRSAGLRTHLLVGVGSTILMIISIHGFPEVFEGHRDPARLAAQVVTGVGFLGAGAIIHGNSGIKGLTTAGTIWASMAIGIACGSFNFILAFGGTLLILVVLTFFKKVEIKVSKRTPTIIMTVGVQEPAMVKILDVCKKFNCTMNHVSISKVEGSNPELIEIVFQANFDEGTCDINLLISELTNEVKPVSIHVLSHL